ncbi:MAG: helix-turn-helix transcriptional regulator [Dehalococcoidia bacterium]
MKKNVIGPRIREGRRKADPPITQIDLVARLQLLGLSIEQSSLSKMENGQRPITDIECEKIAKALDVSIAWLFGKK